MNGCHGRCAVYSRRLGQGDSLKKKNAVSKPKRAKGADKKPIEQYEHTDKKRPNIPPVGLVTPDTDPPTPARRTYQYDPHLDAQLVWAGKAERNITRAADREDGDPWDAARTIRTKLPAGAAR